MRYRVPRRAGEKSDTRYLSIPVYPCFVQFADFRLPIIHRWCRISVSVRAAGPYYACTYEVAIKETVLFEYNTYEYHACFSLTAVRAVSPKYFKIEEATHQ